MHAGRCGQEEQYKKSCELSSVTSSPGGTPGGTPGVIPGGLQEHGALMILSVVGARTEQIQYITVNNVLGSKHAPPLANPFVFPFANPFANSLRGFFHLPIPHVLGERNFYPPHTLRIGKWKKPRKELANGLANGKTNELATETANA